MEGREGEVEGRGEVEAWKIYMREYKRGTLQANLQSYVRVFARAFVSIIPKKVESSIRFFEPFWISRDFHFSLGTFGEVELEPSNETYTQSK